jgi:hypothetical protein
MQVMPNRTEKLLYRKRSPKEHYIEEKVFFDTAEGIPHKIPYKAATEEFKRISSLESYDVGGKLSKDSKALPPSQQPEMVGSGKARRRRVFRLLYVAVTMTVLAAIGVGGYVWKQQDFRFTFPFGGWSQEEAAPSVSIGGAISCPLQPFIVPLNRGSGQLALIFLDITVSSEAKGLLESNLAAVRSAIFKTIWSQRLGDPTSNTTLNQAAYAISRQFQLNAVVKLYCKKISTI